MMDSQEQNAYQRAGTLSATTFEPCWLTPLANQYPLVRPSKPQNRSLGTPTPNEYFHMGGNFYSDDTASSEHKCVLDVQVVRRPPLRISW